MGELTLRAERLTREAFEPFGDVIGNDGSERFSVNAGTMDRIHQLARVEVGDQYDAHATISLFRALRARSLPYSVSVMERHPLGSQAFMPLNGQRFIVVVAPPGEQLARADLRAFITDGSQGVNYHRGVWHMPLAAFEKGQEFLVVDRGGSGKNFEETSLRDPVIVVADP